MIPLLNPAPPPQLTPEFVKEQTAVFVASGKAVWNLDFIKVALLEMGRNKCAYCEAIVSLEGNYMEVEHFRPKSKYQHLVLEWDNLLPSCKRCNVAKKAHDVVVEPIVNPRFERPSEHFYFEGDLLIMGKTQQGIKSERVLKLNDYERIIPKRKALRENILKALELIKNLMDDRLVDTTSRHKHSANALLVQLELIQLTSDHAAFKATFLLRHPIYQLLKDAFLATHHWTEAHAAAEQAARDIALFP